MRSIVVEQLLRTPIEEMKVEIVERKGRGHPDFIADSACEAVCKALCQYYQKKFGMILHHNVDKGLVIGGRAHPVFGGGEVGEPIQIIVAGRAVTEVFEKDKITPIPVGSIAMKAIRNSLEKTFRFLDVDSHVVIMPIIRRGSADLIKLFELGKGIPLANDTSFGVCFAPLSELERLVLETERFLNSEELKKELPEVGEDVKVLGVREKGEISLTISAAIISKLTPDLSHYLNVKEQIRERVADLAARLVEKPVKVYVNTADKPEKESVYITVTGTSAEAGDDGNTGRSNRVYGLITPSRQMSLEAVAGKNPVNHVGKVYNVLAKFIADRIYAEINGIKEVYVKVLSQIGRPIDSPLVTHVQTILQKGYTLERIEPDVVSIVEEELAQVTRITDRILRGEITLF
jgi:S-adenosylmethionine synthetase